MSSYKCRIVQWAYGPLGLSLSVWKVDSNFSFLHRQIRRPRQTDGQMDGTFVDCCLFCMSFVSISPILCNLWTWCSQFMVTPLLFLILSLVWLETEQEHWSFHRASLRFYWFHFGPFLSSLTLDLIYSSLFGVLRHQLRFHLLWYTHSRADGIFSVTVCPESHNCR